ncbi:MAG TPA: hypothetical protein VM819_08485 [Vicinamibacterales bacterium]|nr:hypothetical protein [Vicinamibacterales bacterium]
MTLRRFIIALVLVLVILAVAVYVWVLRLQPKPGSDIQALAERYVRLVLALGQHDPDYVDAYYGPPDWRTEAQHAKVPLAEIDAAADDLAGDLEMITPPATANDLERLRHDYVTRQLASLRARVAMLGGARMKFDAESKALYDAVAPRHSDTEFEAARAELDKRLPGTGTLRERYDAYRARFAIPRDRLDRTFRAAIDGCRERTLKNVRLPDDESFTVEYVKDKSWSAYNWYKGNYRSVIQVNTDLPVHIDRVLVLACHEGYPGHHVNNVLLEKNFVRDRGWHELSVYPLFSPQSLIAEGTADFGVSVAFPGPDRVEFARTVLFPAAGLDASGAADYFAITDLAHVFGYARDEAARRYLDGEVDAAGTIEWLEKYALQSRPRAEQQIKFIDQYRSYVINYTYGQDLVARWVESQGGVASNPQRRWELFEPLISAPRLPSSLATPESP